jgi:uncharacterized protein YraI
VYVRLEPPTAFPVVFARPLSRQEVTMKILSKIAIGAAGIALFSAAAFADEVTTTTTNSTQQPGPGVYVGVPGVVGVQVGAPPSGCTTQSRTTTDTNTGDSRSVTRSNC